MAKSPDAFRTISEVADWLGIQAHVLRFWESKFSQVKPVKRAGGRRYYRPNDMLLLGGIRQLLHEDGLTIKGVQKILRAEGIAYVASLSQPLDELTQTEMEEAPVIEAPMAEEAQEETGTVLSFEKAAEEREEASADATPVSAEAETDTDAPVSEMPEAPATAPEPAAAAPEPETEATDPPETPSPPESAPALTEASAEAPPETPSEAAPASDEDEAQADEKSRDHAASLPAFLRRPMADPPAATDNPPQPTLEAAPEPAPEPPAPRPRDIGMPALTPLDQIAARPGVLTTALRTRQLTPDQARQIAPLLERLAVLRDSMAARRRPGPDS